MRGVKKFKNGVKWDVFFNGDLCRLISTPFFQILQFTQIPESKIAILDRATMRFFVQLMENNGKFRMVSSVADQTINFETRIEKAGDLLWRQMIRLSQGMAHCSASRGIILFHGALASWKGKGVLLCGASGSGKTTASKRLPPSWRSLSDDATLLVRDRQGRYWAHPWPTWSQLLSKKKKSIRQLAGPVRLHAICFLKKSVKDRIANASAKESVVRLMAAAEQALNLTAGIMPVSSRNRQRIDRLDLCCAVASEIPIFHLSASLTGRFWKLIEKTIRLHVPQ